MVDRSISMRLTSGLRVRELNGGRIQWDETEERVDSWIDEESYGEEEDVGKEVEKLKEKDG